MGEKLNIFLQKDYLDESREERTCDTLTIQIREFKTPQKERSCDMVTFSDVNQASLLYSERGARLHR